MLLGREAEQRRTTQVLDAARSGRSAVLAVVGEVGVGKSALLEDTASRAEGMTVLRARGVESETHVPFAGLFDLLRPALDRLHRLPPPQAAALEGALALRPARGTDRFAVGAATLGVLALLAEENPLLVLVDDAHWLDAASAAALVFALRRALADALAAVLAVREGEPSLLDGADLPHLTLRGLPPPAAAELVRRHTPRPLSPASLERLHRDSGGNPLALIELTLEQPSLGGPSGAPLPVVTSVGRLYQRRLRSLSAPARELLVLVAAGDSPDLLLLSTAARGLALDLADLAPAEAVGLVRIDADRVVFRHPLARSAVYADAAPDERRRAHRALAGALPDLAADQRAWHLALAALGPDDAACAALQQAADRARARSAYDASSAAYERASRLAPDRARRARLAYQAADAAWLDGQGDRALALLEQVRSETSADGLVMSVEHLRGHIVTRRGPVRDGLAILLTAAEVASGVDPEHAVVVLAEAMNAAFYAGDAAPMRAVADRIAALPAGGSARGAFFATMAQGMAAIVCGDGERGVELVRRATRLGGSSAEIADDPRLLAWAVMGPLWLREAGAGSAVIADAVDVARSRLAVGVLPFLLSHVALEQAATDRWAEAEATFCEAIALARESDQRTDLAFALARLALLDARQGKAEVCRSRAAESLALSRELGLGLCELWTHAVLIDLELGLGRPTEALRHAERLDSLVDRLGLHDVDLSPVPERVDALLRLRDDARAAPLVESYAAAATAKGQPWALARAARCRALLAEDSGSDALFEEALALHTRAGDLFETARTQLAYGGRLRRMRARVRSREHLGAALEAFDRLGARPWAGLAAAELAATGATARRRQASTALELTPQERQIAAMLAEGRTTRQAAAALFLSPKTIEHHLRSVYRKLGVSSRDELAQLVRPAAVSYGSPATTSAIGLRMPE